MNHRKGLGQYFTVSEELQNFVFDRVKHKSCRLLEPSFGAGHLLKKFKEYNSNYPITCYELDPTITPVVSFNEQQTCVYADFTQADIREKYKTIIGNPPYVKQPAKANLYIRFIELCFQYLADDGELIFIVPSDFLKLTSAAPIIQAMTEYGSFTDFLFPHDERLFEGASIDVVVFRYEKGLHTPRTVVNGNHMFCNVNEGIITFSEQEMHGDLLSNSFDAYVGLVSGRDHVYRAPIGNIDILMDKEKVERFIFLETFPSENAAINQYLEAHKEELMGRKIRKFSDTNWFEWGAPRNLTSIRARWGAPCIYLRNMTRQKEVAFLGTVQYFSGSLLCLIPKPSNNHNLQDVIDYLNSPAFQKDYLYAGRFKIGHKQISNAILPE